VSAQFVSVATFGEDNQLRRVRLRAQEPLLLVSSLSGMSDLNADLEHRIGCPLFIENDALNKAIRIIEFRNLIVHNRARINRIFLTRIPNFAAKPGDVLKLSVNEFFSDASFLAEHVKCIDERARAKFRLPTPSI
jgi:hypothetical protein